MNKVVVLLLALFSLTIQAQNGKKELKLEDIVAGKFAQKRLPSMTFMADGAHYARLEDGNRIVKYAISSGKEVDVVLSPDRLSWEGNIAGFSFSEDNNFLVFYTSREKVYRHSFDAKYYFYDIRLKRLTAVADGEMLRAVTLSPDAKKLAYVKDNNIYVYHTGFKTIRQVTEDGEFNKVINGIPDWVYEEEFSCNRLMEWSPDSRFLAWIRSDESEVPEFSFPLYKDHALQVGYMDKYVYKYPKAGAINSKVEAYVFDYTNKVSRKMKVDTDSEEVYLPRVFWSKSSDKLGIARLNRHQNNLQILFANPKSGVCTIIINEENDRYIDQQSYSNIAFLDDGLHFVYQSEQDGFNHLYLYTVAGRMVKQLTKGDYDVTAFLGYDAKARKYYYEAAKKSPLEREVYSLNSKSYVQCITPLAGTNSVIFSSNFLYSIRSHSSSQKPFHASVYDKKGAQMYSVVDNEALEQKLVQYKFTPREFFTVVNENGDTLNGWMVKPLNFDENTAYPLLMTQYSGPGSQQVANSFAFAWDSYLAQEGYMVVCVDGRGTGFRGQEFKKCTYLNLGQYESDDQIAVAKHFGALPYVDANRIGIWGWSYGGFMSSLCLSRGNGVFKAGIAVAPVTHFKFYDTVYTERFMRTPQENPDGYNNYAPLMLADKLQGNLLLCHGTADDNVHYQNTVDYAEALVQAGQQFDMQIYRNRNHSIYGGNTRQHLYARFVKFLNDNL